jgi:hypothetical protein
MIAPFLYLLQLAKSDQKYNMLWYGFCVTHFIVFISLQDDLLLLDFHSFHDTGQ